MSNCLNTTCWKDLFFPPYCFCTIVKNQLAVLMWLFFWVLLFCFIDFCVYSLAYTRVSWYCVYIVSLKIRKCDSNFFFFKIALTFLVIPWKFYIRFVYICKSSPWNSLRNCIKARDQFGENWYLCYVEFSNTQTWYNCIYLDIWFFFLISICSFRDTNFVNILLDLYVNISPTSPHFWDDCKWY